MSGETFEKEKKPDERALVTALFARRLAHPPVVATIGRHGLAGEEKFLRAFPRFLGAGHAALTENGVPAELIRDLPPRSSTVRCRRSARLELLRW